MKDFTNTQVAIILCLSIIIALMIGFIIGCRLTDSQYIEGTRHIVTYVTTVTNKVPEFVK